MINASPRLTQYLEGLNTTGSTIGKYLAVMGGPADIQLPSGVASPIYGITREDIIDGRHGDVQVSGVAAATAGEVISAAAILAGARVYADTSGKMMLWDAAAGVNQAVAGTPLTPAAADGDLFDLLLGSGGVGQGA